MYESLMKYYKFVSREFFDEESGAVYNAVGKNPARKRLYNAPWMSVFMLEMYNLTGETVCLALKTAESNSQNIIKFQIIFQFDRIRFYDIIIDVIMIYFLFVKK